MILPIHVQARIEFLPPLAGFAHHSAVTSPGRRNISKHFANRFIGIRSMFHRAKGWLEATDGAPIYTDGIDGEQAN